MLFLKQKCIRKALVDARLHCTLKHLIKFPHKHVMRHITNYIRMTLLTGFSSAARQNLANKFECQSRVLLEYMACRIGNSYALSYMIFDFASNNLSVLPHNGKRYLKHSFPLCCSGYNSFER